MVKIQAGDYIANQVKMPMDFGILRNEAKDSEVAGGSSGGDGPHFEK